VSFISNILTGADNHTQDIGRFSWAISVISIIVLAAHEVWAGHPIDFNQFGMGLGAIVGAHGLALWAKKDTEPRP